jgi:hypothetical protein
VLLLCSDHIYEQLVFKLIDRWQSARRRRLRIDVLVNIQCGSTPVGHQRRQHGRPANTNYAGRDISIGPYQLAQNGQPAQAMQANFYSPVGTAGGFFGSGGPRAYQFATRIGF